jgi:hypothetical protein
VLFEYVHSHEYEVKTLYAFEISRIGWPFREINWRKVEV